MTDITQGQLAQMVSGCTKMAARDVPACHGMTDSLRTLIEATLAQAQGLCLDNPADRAALSGLLLGALRPLDIEQHPTALEAELARAYEERDAARAALGAMVLLDDCPLTWEITRWIKGYPEQERYLVSIDGGNYKGRGATLTEAVTPAVKAWRDAEP